MPLWLTRSDDTPNDVIPHRGHMQGLRGLLERHQALWRVDVPDGAGPPRTRAVWFGEIDMADRPASVCTDLIQRQLDDRLEAGGLVSRSCNGLQQLQQGGTLSHLLGERGIEGLESFVLLAQGQVLFLQQATVRLQHL